MFKKISIFMIALLFVCSIAMATGNNHTPTLSGSVSQLQSFTIGDTANSGMATVLALTHGDAYASVSQSLNIDNTQSTPSNTKPNWNFGQKSISTTGLQTQSADLSQNSSASGSFGIINVNSFLDAVGSQQQLIGFSTDLKQQAQSLGLAAQQVLTRADGSGCGDSANSAQLSQMQTGSNTAGSVLESSTIDALQTSYTGGAANSTTALATSLTAMTNQNQQVFK